MLSQSDFPSLASGVVDFDKVEHVSTYGLPGLLVFEALLRRGIRSLPKVAAPAILVTLAFGIAHECHRTGRRCVSGL